MGLLDRLFGRRRARQADARPLTGPEAVARWRHLLVTAPAEALAAAHTSGFETLGDDVRGEVVHRMRSALSALEPGAVIPADPAVLVRAAARAERRAPGFLERALSTDARGGRALTGLAAAVVATSAAAPFLRSFGAGPSPEAVAAGGPPELDVPDTPGSSSGHDGDHELDDED